MSKKKQPNNSPGSKKGGQADAKAEAKRQRNENRKTAAKEWAKEATIKRAQRDLQIAGQLARGDILGGLKQGVRNAISDTGKAVKYVYRVVTGTNDTGWYLKYGKIEVASNTSRPMGPRFNKDITVEAMKGNTCRMMDIACRWRGFQNSFMWKQTMNNSYQLLRLKLKSNLPYSQRKLEAYLFDSLVMYIALKQVERDVHWYNYSDPDITDFQELYIRRAIATESYGAVELEADPILKDGSWADTVSGYERLVRSTSTNIKVPPSLALFISHYFGSMFTDQCDGANDQFVYLRMLETEWATYDAKTDSVTYAPLDLKSMSIDQLTKLVVELGTEFGIVIADLVNSGQYVPGYLDPVGEYDYTKVYDVTLMQAIQNAYTDKSAMTEEGFIRLDLFPGVTDPYTQFLFLGGLQDHDDHSDNLIDFPAIEVLSVCLKYDSDSELSWPAGLGQNTLDIADGSSDLREASLKFDSYFGVNVRTTIEEDVHVTIESANGVVALYLNNLSWKKEDRQETLSGKNDLQLAWNTSANRIAVVYHANGMPGGGGDEAALYIPLLASLATSDQYNDDGTGKPIIGTPEIGTAYSTVWILKQTNAGEKSLVWTTMADWITFSRSNNAYGNNPYKQWSYPVYSNVGDGVFNFRPAGTVTFSTGNQSIFQPVFEGSSTSSIFKYLKVLAGKLEIHINGSTEWPATSSDYPIYMLRESDFLSATMSITSAFRIVVDSTSKRQAISYVSGFKSLATAAAKESHMMIPIYPVSRVTVETRVTDGTKSKSTKAETSRTVVTARGALIKHEHAPYWYNVKDLAPVLYRMMLSLFTPVDDIYRLLNLRRGSEPERKDSQNPSR